jgi:hypothetical protein
MNSKLSRLSRSVFEVRTALIPRLLGVATLSLTMECAFALPNQEDPSQRDWVAREHADVVTGALYPAALLVSRSTSASQAKAKIGLGYLAVGNYSKRPMEVTFSWDSSRLWNRGVTGCKPNGCELQIRFGAAKAMKFIAVQDKNSPTLILQDGHSFVAEAAQRSGAIEAQIQTLEDGLLIFQFNTGSRLQVEKLKK